MNISIRLLEERDAYTSVVWRNIPEIWELTGSKPDKEITIDDELNWIRKAIKDSTARRFAIVADGTYVGNIYLTDIKDGLAQYHIFIGDRDFWGKGVAKQASRQLLDYAKTELKLKRIFLEVNKNHTAAQGLYRKLGFVETKADKSTIIMELDLETAHEN